MLGERVLGAGRLEEHPPQPLVDADESLAIARVVDAWRAGGPKACSTDAAPC